MQKLYRAALAVLAVCPFVIVACTANTPTTSSVPEPVASVSTPTPAANPTPAPAPTPSAGEGEEVNDGYLCEFGNDASFSIKNTTDIRQEYRAYITSFDNQEQELDHKLSEQSAPGGVPPGESWGGSFNRQCVQLDITQFGYAGLPLKGCATYYDKNGRQFNNRRNPEKIAECRTPPPPPCEGKWVEDEKPTVTDGEWGICSATRTSLYGFQSTNGTYCSKKKTVTYTYYETNSCTQERRVSRVVEREETEKCECPPPPKPEYCFYEVTGQDKSSKCTGKGGTWENWDNEEHHNHCRLAYPGISDDAFNLTPGQSENGCLRKQDDE